MGDTEVPYVDLVRQHEPIREEVLDAVDNVLDHGQFILGPEVEEFEATFADRIGVDHAVGVNSGTDALALALRALDVGPGDEVITAPNSFVATASAVALAGATPLFADVGPDYNLDSREVEAALTDDTAAILPVHLTGRPAKMDPLLDIAEDHHLHVIEDAAQAVLAEDRGRKVGAIGDVGCFSLHPLKTLNACGDAGILTTDEQEFAERLRVLRNIGLEGRDRCTAWSTNSRLDSIQASILLEKLDHLDRWTQARRDNAEYYAKRLGDVDGLSLPDEGTDQDHVYHTYVIQSEDREGLQAHLDAHDIGSAVHYPTPIHLQPVAEELGYERGDFPIAEKQAERILSIPVHQDLSSAERERVADRIREFHT